MADGKYVSAGSLLIAICVDTRTLGAVVHVAISLTSPTLRFSGQNTSKPSIVVKTTLISPDVITVDIRGKRDAGTILGGLDQFRGLDSDLEFEVENFSFYDTTTSKPVVYDLFPGTCMPGDNFIELSSTQPRITKMQLRETDPLAAPVDELKAGHTYRVTLKPQTVRCWAGGVDDLLARREPAPPPEGEEGEEVPEGPPAYNYPGAMDLTLACEEELVLKVEE